MFCCCCVWPIRRLLVTEIKLKLNTSRDSSDYGDKDNDDLKERFGIKKDDYPEYRLFVRGKEEPLIYQGDEGKSEEIVRFIAEKTGRSLVADI